jgi:aldose 1-epimerase
MNLPTRLGLCLLAVAPACAVLDAGGSISREPWGTVDGRPVELFTLRNRRGTTLKVTDYGAIVTELDLPDRKGAFADVVLGFDSLAGYLGEQHPYFGCIAGRCANRIAGASFELDGRRYELARNDGRNHLHGGLRGFDRYVWEPRAEETAEGPSLLLTRVSPDGEEGYPGRLEASVRYTLTDDDVLRVEMSATTDAPTLANLVQHTYWNLAGHASGTVEGHVLRFHAHRYVPVDGELLPLGRFDDVAGTPFDFRTPKAVGAELRAVDAGPALPRGYDHDFVIDGGPRAFRPVCELVEPTSGRSLELWSDQPGCQLYTGNFLDGTIAGKAGTRYPQYAGLCLETELHPDSIHHPGWPSPVLRPGERYEHRMELRFGVEP